MPKFLADPIQRTLPTTSKLNEMVRRQLISPGYLAKQNISNYERSREKNIARNIQVMKDMGLPITLAGNGKRKRIAMDDDNCNTSDDEDDNDNDSLNSFEREISEIPDLQGCLPFSQRDANPIYDRVTRSTSHMDVDPKAPPCVVEQQIQETPIVAHDVVGSRRNRGPNRGLTIQQLFDKQGKLEVRIPSQFRAPVGDFACKMAANIGLEIRTNMTDPTLRRWKAADESVKAPMIQRDHFDMKGDPNDVDKAVGILFGRRLSGYTYRLHKKYKDIKSSKGADYDINHPPSNVTVHKWTNLSDNKWSDSKFKIQSVANTENRSKMKTKTRRGTRYIPVRVDEMMRKNDNCVPKLTDVYEFTHFNSKTNQWISRESQENYERMIQIEAKHCSQNGFIPMSQEELSIKVLKATSGYVKGLGMRPSSLRIIGATVDNNEHVLRLESIIEKQKEEMEAQKYKIDELSESNKQLEIKTSKIIEYLKQQGMFG